MDEPMQQRPERMRIGPLAAIVILVLVFLLGGVYFFMYEKARLTTPPMQQTINA